MRKRLRNSGGVRFCRGCLAGRMKFAMKKLLCPSMMCADFAHLVDEVKLLEEAGADIFHCDVMDGAYVPNMTMGVQDIKCIRASTDRLVDVHLMVERPSRVLQLFLDAGCDILYLHADSDRYVGKCLLKIREAGRYAGLAVNPDEPVEKISELLPLCDYVMVMTVYPGFAGQAFLEHVRGKLYKLARLKRRYGFRLMMDGACSPERIRELSAAGVDGFILGTSALFGKQESYAEVFQCLRSE